MRLHSEIRNFIEWAIFCCPGATGVRLRRRSLIRSLMTCGDALVVQPNCQFLAAGNISIGHRFKAGSGSILSAADGELTIGDDCKFNFRVTCIADSGNIIIQSGSVFAPNVVMRSGLGNRKVQRLGYRDDVTRDRGIIIRKNAWIASNVVIGDGADIGSGSVVGANSFVNGLIPDKVLAVGCPARPIKALE